MNINIFRRQSLPWMLLALAAGILSTLGLTTANRSPGAEKFQGTRPSLPHRRTRPTHRTVLPHAPTKKTVMGLPQPSAAHPLTILSVGDSLGEDLGDGLQDILQSRSHIRLVLDSVGSTGLANVAYYNWPTALSRALAQVHPQLAVILIGGNDAVGFDQGGQPVFFGTPLWHKDYSRRVAMMMSEATRAKARVIWVGLPIMAKHSVLSNRAMKALNAVYAAEAKTHPGVTFFPSWKLFQNAAGHFTARLKDPAGFTTIVRDPDGVHIAPPAGQELIASAVLGEIDRLEHWHVCPNPSDYWPEFTPKGC